MVGVVSPRGLKTSLDKLVAVVLTPLVLIPKIVMLLTLRNHLVRGTFQRIER